MQIQLGYELVYDFAAPTPMITMLNVHYSRVSDLLVVDHMKTAPAVPIHAFRDSFGNWCNRLLAPQGNVRIFADALLRDTGQPDPVVADAEQSPIELLPADSLVFLLGSRYCETDRLQEIAWRRFGQSPSGWNRVQTICNFVHEHIQFGYEYANPSKTAWQVYHERTGVCRDYAHLAIALCRCMNIPARYCTGYLGDIGLPPPYAPMDFAAWFEAYLNGRWYTFDPRNNAPRIGRVLIAHGRDAADVAITTTFGPNTLKSFRVVTYEVTGEPQT